MYLKAVFVLPIYLKAHWIGPSGNDSCLVTSETEGSKEHNFVLSIVYKSWTKCVDGGMLVLFYSQCLDHQIGFIAKRHGQFMLLLADVLNLKDLTKLT